MPIKSLLMIPGPTPVPDEVLRALSHPMINHRGPEYMAMQRELVSGLKSCYKTENDLHIYPCAGTGGLESAVVNVLSPGDKVIGAPIGAFGDRFCEIAEVYGGDVRRISTEWGRAVDPEAVAAALRETPEAKAVIVTHNETSTGVLNDIPAIAKAARSVSPEVLLLVDGVSGMLASDLRTDEWGLDVVVSGSQKAWQIPPGLAFLSISQRAWAAHKTAKMPRFYFDWTRMQKSMQTDQTPYTPALPQQFGLQVALRKILAEGLDESFRRHYRLGAATRAAIEALGLELFAACNYSNSLTAIKAPAGLTAKDIRLHMRDHHGVVIAGGQGKIKDAVFRIGHLGYVDENDILATLAALEQTLRDLGRDVPQGAGVTAAAQVLAGN